AAEQVAKLQAEAAEKLAQEKANTEAQTAEVKAAADEKLQAEAKATAEKLAKEKAEAEAAAMEKAGLKVLDITRQGEWSSVTAVK
ncbi:MAG: hypothetical protein J6V94_06160, partial [Lachnospiraceae bacterium]|nr:hypothetical protein [Lachnospiraceae bacterium]